MKKRNSPSLSNALLLILLTLSAGVVFGQKKSLGVGTATPNENAALHVESPGNNQGFIMPRLTTAQRTAMSSLLTVNDNGLTLYDTQLKTIFIWDGQTWKSSAQVAGGPKLTYPYVDTVTVSPGVNSGLFRLAYNGTATENVGVANFQNLNVNNGFSPIFGLTRSATNGVADFVVNNPTNNNDGIGVSTNSSLGRAGAFTINNTANRSFAVLAQTNGDSTGAAVHGNNIGNGFGVFGKSAGTKFASAAVYGEHVGTGDAAGAFRISNASNTYSALYGETNGTGAAVYGRAMSTGFAGLFIQTDTTSNRAALQAQSSGLSPTIFGAQLGKNGRAGQFQITNAQNTNAALRAFTSGLSNAGFFTINNPANNFPAVFAETNGIGPALSGRTTSSGPAVYGENLGTANGFAGLFRVTESSNNFPAVQGNNLAGSGSVFRAFHTGTGAGVDVFMNNATSTGIGVVSNQNGLGNSGAFNINNAANTSPALYASSNGTGSALSTFMNGTGRAAFFDLNNSASSSPAVTVVTNATTLNGSGRGLEVFQNGQGDAIYSRANSGSAGNFHVTNPSNASSALFAMTDAPMGHAIGAINTAQGRAFSIFQGGMRISTATLSTGTTITVRAGAYLITGGGPYNFDPSLMLEDGDIFYFINSTLNAVTVGSFSINPGEGRAAIYIGGALRAL